MSNIIGFKPRDKVKTTEEEQVRILREMYAFLTTLTHEQYFGEINRQYIPDEDNPFNAWFENFTKLTYAQVAEIYDADFVLSFKGREGVNFEPWLEDLANLATAFFKWVKGGNQGDQFSLTNILAGTREVFQTIFIKTNNGIYLRDIYLDCKGTIATVAMYHYCESFNCSVADVYGNTVDESL